MSILSTKEMQSLAEIKKAVLPLATRRKNRINTSDSYSYHTGCYSGCLGGCTGCRGSCTSTCAETN